MPLNLGPAVPILPGVLAANPVGWLILGGLVLYGGSSLYDDFAKTVGLRARDEGAPLISLPLGMIALGIGLALLATRR